MGTHRDLWRSMGAYGDLWGPMRAYGVLCGPMVAYGDLWGPSGPTGAHVGPLAPMGTYSDLWGPMGTHGAVQGPEDGPPSPKCPRRSLPLPKWWMGCCCNRSSLSGTSGQWWPRGGGLQLRQKLQEALRARDAAKAAEGERDQLRTGVKGPEAHRPKGLVQQQQHGVGTEGGGVGKDRGGGLQYLIGATQDWQQQAEAAKGQLSTVGSTVRPLLSQQGGGSTMETILPDYRKILDAHDNVASKFPTETMVQATCNPGF